MNQFIYNMKLNMDDLNFAMDAMYKRTNYLRRFVKKNSAKIFFMSVCALGLFYNHQKQIEELESRIDQLEAKLYDFSEPVEAECSEDESTEE